MDRDGDGFTTSEDCNDNDPGIYPGAPEVCDGFDNDCDDDVDGDASDVETWFADADEDGYGDDKVWTTACDAPDGFVARPGDCDDQDATVSPDGDDIGEDGIDQDCDGSDAVMLRWGWVDDWAGGSRAVYPGFQYFTPVEIPLDTTLRGVGGGPIDGRMVHLAVYDDRNGAPNTLLAAARDVSVVRNNTEVLFDEPIALPKGTYWVSTVANVLARWNQASDNDSWCFDSFTYGDPLPTSPSPTCERFHQPSALWLLVDEP